MKERACILDLRRCYHVIVAVNPYSSLYRRHIQNEDTIIDNLIVAVYHFRYRQWARNIQLVEPTNSQNATVKCSIVWKIPLEPTVLWTYKHDTIIFKYTRCLLLQ